MKFDQEPTLEKEFIFKKLTSDDWNGYKEARLASLKTDPESFGSGSESAESQMNDELWKEHLDDSDWSFYAAKHKESFVSIVNLMKVDVNNWRVMGVYTIPEFRGKHLSEELINQAINEAKQKKASKVSLYVSTTQEPAIKLYEKLGFQIVKTYKEEKMQDGTPFDLYYMEKDLTQ